MVNSRLLSTEIRTSSMDLGALRAPTGIDEEIGAWGAKIWLFVDV
jgi:hypothetical protein